MEFTITFRIYYNEDVTRETEDDVREELANDIMTSPAITDMTVQTVFMSQPYEAIIDVTYNDLHLDTDENESRSLTQEKNILRNELALLPYLHNVIQE